MQDDSTASVPDAAPPASEASGFSFVPETHRGDWSGPNRLWMMDPEAPERSDGALTASGNGLEYTWSRGEKEHKGRMEFAGQPAAMRAAWVDTFHAAEEQSLHGFVQDGVMRLFGTYPAGNGTEWGWQIEIDTRDREAFALRMFNVVPGVGPVPAVSLQGTR